MFRREPTADVFDWLVTAATGRQPDQVDVEQVPSLEDGTAAMLGAAERGCGLTLAVRDAFQADKHPQLKAIPFVPALRHDVTLIWSPARKSPALRVFAQHCTTERDASEA
jgi:hypothetical protein